MAAPKENKYAEGHGRPLKHTDEQQFNNLIKDYFEYIEGEEGTREKEFINNEGEKDSITETYWIRKPEPPTVTGLAIHLGFADKKSIYDYRKRGSFLHSIKKAITMIEKHHEIKIAYGDKCIGNIFALKNFGWTDKIKMSYEEIKPIVTSRDE